MASVPEVHQALGPSQMQGSAIIHVGRSPLCIAPEAQASGGMDIGDKTASLILLGMWRLYYRAAQS